MRTALCLAASCLMAVVAPERPGIAGVRDRIREYRQAHEVAILEELRTLLEIPKVAADRTNAAGLGQAPPSEVADLRLFSYLKAHAIPLTYVEAGHGFADLEPLADVLRHARIVGLGEATHGTREFVQVKHRLVEFLVTRLGFGALVLEASAAACEPINEFVLHGTGDLADVLSKQGYLPWDTEEFAALVRWMRKYNDGVPADRRVRFYGMDIWKNDRGRERLTAFIGRHAPELSATAADLFGQLAELEAKWPMRLSEADRALMPGLSSALDALVDRIPGLGKTGSGTAEHGSVHLRRYVRAMAQWLEANGPGGSNVVRSRLMAENVIALAERSPELKLVVWASNSHIVGRARTTAASRAATATKLGEYLRARFGETYYALGLEFYSGTYLTRVLEPGEPPGDLRVATAPEPSPDMMASKLAALALDRFIVDLRGASRAAQDADWLAAPQTFHDFGWRYYSPDHRYAEIPLRPYFDGLLFLKHTTATTPTAGGAAAARDGRGF